MNHSDSKEWYPSLSMQYNEYILNSCLISGFMCMTNKSNPNMKALLILHQHCFHGCSMDVHSMYKNANSLLAFTRTHAQKFA